VGRVKSALRQPPPLATRPHRNQVPLHATPTPPQPFTSKNKFAQLSPHARSNITNHISSPYSPNFSPDNLNSRPRLSSWGLGGDPAARAKLPPRPAPGMSSSPARSVQASIPHRSQNRSARQQITHSTHSKRASPLLVRGDSPAFR
jgi:hypothetical protein